MIILANFKPIKNYRRKGMKRTVLLTVVTLLSWLLFFTASNVMGQDFCRGDFNYNGSVGAEDVTEFLNNFGRSQYNNPCPLDGPAPVQKTGQTRSFKFRDDGDLEKGVASPNPRFTDNGDNTVTDHLTGLMWTKSAAPFGQKYTWNESFDQVTALNGLSKYNDWRVPNVRELMSLIDFGEGVFSMYCQDIAALPEGHPFTNVKVGIGFGNCTEQWYWTSTRLLSKDPNIDYASIVNFAFAQITYGDPADIFYVWPVRGGRSPLHQ